MTNPEQPKNDNSFRNQDNTVSHQKPEFDSVRLELQELTILEMEQQLTEPQVARLKELICNNPAACKYYVSLQYDKIFLNEIATSIVSDPTGTVNDEANLPNSLGKTSFPLVILNSVSKPVAIGLSGGILFVLMVFSVLLFVNIKSHFFSSSQVSSNTMSGQPTIGDDAPRETPQNKFVAELTGTKNAVWSNAKQQPALSSRLFPGQHLNLESGLIELHFKTGARVVLAGPVELVLGGEDQGSDQPKPDGFLKLGRLVAHVPPSAVGFTIQTPTAVVTDLGTQFGINVNANGKMNLGVLNGTIEWGLLGTTHRSRLTTGQEIIVNAAGVQVDKHGAFTGQFVALVEQQLNTDFNEDDTNTLRVVEFAKSNKGRNYPVISGGAKAGVKLFSDREYRLDDAAFREFPEPLEGADLIQLANEEKLTSDLTIAVKFQHAGTLFLFQRKSQKPSEWLLKKFQPTFHEVAAKSTGIAYEYNVWMRQMEKGETVLLESAFNESDQGMYGLAAKHRDSE